MKQFTASIRQRIRSRSLRRIEIVAGGDSRSSRPSIRPAASHFFVNSIGQAPGSSSNFISPGPDRQRCMIPDGLHLQPAEISAPALQFPGHRRNLPRFLRLHQALPAWVGERADRVAEYRADRAAVVRADDFLGQQHSFMHRQIAVVHYFAQGGRIYRSSGRSKNSASTLSSRCGPCRWKWSASPARTAYPWRRRLIVPAHPSPAGETDCSIRTETHGEPGFADHRRGHRSVPADLAAAATIFADSIFTSQSCIAASVSHFFTGTAGRRWR